MEDEETKTEIQEYLNSHRKCTIAITDGERPSAYTMFYVNSGFNLFFESDPVSQKVAILQANPHISLTIDDDQEDWSDIRGIQLFGTASLVAESKSAGLREAFSAKFRSVKSLGGIPATHMFIEIQPEKIYYLDFSKGFGHRTVYHVEHDKGRQKERLSW